jgi:hypothetical protein
MTSFVLDTFTGSGGTTLAAHVGETGATWASVSGTPSDLTAYALNGSGQLVMVSALNPLYASGTPTSADYFVEIELIPTFSFLPYIQVDVYLRIASPGGGHTQYIVRYDFLNSIVKFGTTTAGLTTISGSSVALTSGTTSVIRVEIAGTTITAKLRDITGVDQVSPMVVTSSTYAAAGSVGFASILNSVTSALINRFEAGGLGPTINPAFWTKFVGSYEIP